MSAPLKKIDANKVQHAQMFSWDIIVRLLIKDQSSHVQ